MTLLEEIESLARSMAEGKAVTPSELRRAAADHARSAAGLGDAAAKLPPEWTGYIDKVARHAYKVTDEDVEALRRAGRSEDEIFEITMATALGAALARARAGFRAVRGGS